MVLTQPKSLIARSRFSYHWDTTPLALAFFEFLLASVVAFSDSFSAIYFHLLKVPQSFDLDGYVWSLSAHTNWNTVRPSFCSVYDLLIADADTAKWSLWNVSLLNVVVLFNLVTGFHKRDATPPSLMIMVLFSCSLILIDGKHETKMIVSAS